ncbi:peptide/nickel transport system ATP-binding protein [Streptosporangium becharense]|uniref:Peptide/nickel transport system ATP-binding protein n=1 Tax=Streptosporangium becharense TaxID=1816182 RepID=A0A7W9MEF4_9ACTN|nr:ABC transporter ATP-binding protein [Streptosporangium becharense]MBB2910711.1 peptide/nickel transport system ATP-binding protein [Streptosporangium becharense]MBB5817406.1 peptide/nickel transport system ATP-binding protein [Streptosporangium becharense]
MRISGLRISGSGLIVDGVDLEVSSGETVGLVGESGSGKSLTARAAAGLLPKGLRATGSVTLDGRELLGTRERVWRSVRGTRVSLLMQDPFAMLNPLRTAGAHIAESMRGRRDRAEVLRRLAEVGIDDPDVARRHPFQLSGGMRQRVALAAALAADPELLIADEPTTALDATTQHEILMLIKDIQRTRGMGVLLITHDLRVAFELCDRVAVMYAGRIIEQGPAAEMGKEPAHPYTAGLLAAVPTVERRLPRLTGIRGSVPAAAEVSDVCAFAARCDQATPECAHTRPPLRELRPDRLTACLHEVRPRILPEEGPRDRREIGAEEVLRVTELRKAYGSYVALGGVSLHVNRGESVGVVGGSGSGKTTLARCVLGLVRPDAGTIELADPLQPRHRLVQCVFQDPSTSLNPALTVGATLAEAAAQGPAKGGLTVAELLELVGLPATYASRRPAGLSGGERQRVAIARALSVQPALLICDEPVASLDVSVQAHVLELLREVGTSMVFITHDLAVVRQMADRLVVLSRGEVVESGDTAQVLDAPAHDYTRRLVASAPATP